MKEREILIRLDDDIFTNLQQQVLLKRRAGNAGGFSDVFLIRLCDALEKDMRVLSFKIKKNSNSPIIQAQKVDKTTSPK